ncbi:MAG TPA: hypothetical protein VEU47_13380 [Candidatus Cybelea sp.]|nr:hypothetical protein [Candidatus Cybelea sp.]
MRETTATELALAKAFFDRFVAAFATFEAERVSELFATPGVALRSDGSIVALTAREDVLRYYQAALDRYRRDGCRSCRWGELEVTPMGRRSMLAAVTWELLREDGSVLVRWRQSYGLNNTDGAPKAFASATHVE